MAAQPAQMSAKQANDLARQLVLNNSQNMMQLIFSQTFDPNAIPVLNIQPKYVGIWKGFLVEITATILNASTTQDLALTNFNVANTLSQIQFTDLSNYTRIQTSGWHMAFLNSVKRKRPFGSVNTLNGMPIKYGNNFPNNIVSGAGITHNGGGTATGTISMMYYVPITYSDFDLRGMIYGGVVNATATLQLTVNPANTAFVASGADPTLAIMQSAGALAAGTKITTMTVNVYQHYLDQLPVGKNGVIYPYQDASIMYMMLNTNQSGMVQNQDFPMPFANFRDFLSTFAVYDNAGSANAGSDVAYWALQAANLVNYYKVDPFVQSLGTRNEIGVDLPLATYYFNTRNKPLSTQQYGNQSLVLNSSNVNAGASVLLGYEMFGAVNTVIGAGSLPGG